MTKGNAVVSDLQMDNSNGHTGIVFLRRAALSSQVIGPLSCPLEIFCSCGHNYSVTPGPEAAVFQIFASVSYLGLTLFMAH